MPAANHASIKLSTTFLEEARREADVLHRSVGAQVEHWARLGQAIENAPGFSIRRVREALAGRLQLESLSEAEQDRLFEGLGAAFDAPDAQMRDHFAALGAREGAVGTDGRGGVIRRQASSRQRRTA
ncbi:MAG: hypothetical protein JWQ52_17 [Phenylobacterium sp.]|nr:hypothetical protein [Phenylobacterium sp.]